jgi:hypothetical protein
MIPTSRRYRSRMGAAAASVRSPSCARRASGLFGALAAGVVLICLPAAGASYGFSVDVSLSIHAAAALHAKHEKIVVVADYWGYPRPAFEKMADDMGRVGLGTEEVVIAGEDGRAVVSGAKVLAAHVSWVQEPQVLIKVSSTRLGDQKNLLDCGIFEGSILDAQTRQIAVTCRLIGER